MIINTSPQQTTNGLVFSPDFPTLTNQIASQTPPIDHGDLNLDEDALRTWLLHGFRNDIRDKEEFGWAEKRKWDINAYYGVKSLAMMNFPYKGASAYRSALTPTILDTAAANIKASMWDESGKIVKCSTEEEQLVRIVPILESAMNNKVNHEIDIEDEMDSCIFRTFLAGTTALKVIRDFKNNVKVVSFDSENLFCPADAKGLQIDDTDRLSQIIPLTYNDIQIRKRFYKDIDKVQPGIGLGQSSGVDLITFAKDRATGTSLTNRYRRETYFIAETYGTYYPPNSMRSVELIVWWSPRGMTIHRVRENVDGFRPFADYHAYKNVGRFWAMSLPEKIRPEQEKIDYADKQNTDSLDKSISPAMFLDHTDEFDPNVDQRIPTGVYKIGRNNNIHWEQQPPRELGFERERQYIWQMAEKKTGIFDITQGAQTEANRTLGEVKITSTRADVRFSTLLGNFQKGGKKTFNLIYEYMNRYESRQKKLRLIGFKDFRKIDEIFPNPGIGQGLGLQGRIDFSFSGSSVIDVERQKQNRIMLYQSEMINPLFLNDKAALWKATKAYEEALGEKDFDSKIAKPKEVNIYSYEEFIQRVMSGEYDIVPRPGIDTDQYYFELNLFMRTDTFQSLEPQAQQTIANAMKQAYIMGVAERQALTDVTSHIAASQMGAQPQLPLGRPQVPQQGAQVQ